MCHTFIIIIIIIIIFVLVGVQAFPHWCLINFPLNLPFTREYVFRSFTSACCILHFISFEIYKLDVAQQNVVLEMFVTVSLFSFCLYHREFRVELFVSVETCIRATHTYTIAVREVYGYEKNISLPRCVMEIRWHV